MALYKLSEKDKKTIANRKIKRQEKTEKDKLKYTVEIQHPSYVLRAKVGTKKAATELKSANSRMQKAVKAYKSSEKKLANLRLKDKQISNKLIIENKKLQKERDLAFSNLNSKIEKSSFKNNVTQIFDSKRGKIHNTIRTLQDANYVLKKNEYAKCKLRVLKPLITDTGSEYYVNDYMYSIVYPFNTETISELCDDQMSPYKGGEDFEITDFQVISTRIYKRKK